MAISSDLMEKLINLFHTQNLTDENTCKAYLMRALGTGETVSYKVLWDKAQNYIPFIIKELDALDNINSGQPALCAFLKVFYGEVGTDIQKSIDELIQQIIKEKEPQFFTPIKEKFALNGNNKPKIDKDEVYNALLRLNFYHQVKIFRDLVEQNSVGAWIIHGKQGCGQRWLLHRLIQQIPNNSQNHPKVIPIRQHKIYSKKIENIWKEISRNFDSRNYLSNEQIIDAIYNCCKSQNVIIIFHEVDNMPEDWIQALIRDLWLKLVKKASDIYSYKLLMFFIDETGYIENWAIKLRDSSDNNCKPDLPIKLPLIKNLSCDDLDSWIKNHLNVLPISLIKLEDIQSFLEKCDGGSPLTVLENICEECGYNLWEDMKDKWLKY